MPTKNHFQRGRHVITLDDDTTIDVALRSKVDKKEITLINYEYKLENILSPKNYYLLWHSKARQAYWKKCRLSCITSPKEWQEWDRTSCDPLEFHGTIKSERIACMLKQKFAYCHSDTSQYINQQIIRFEQVHVGMAYETADGLKIVVTDVKMDKDGQIVEYFHILEFSLYCIDYNLHGHRNY